MAAMAATVETAAMTVTAGNGGEERDGNKGRGGSGSDGSNCSSDSGNGNSTSYNNGGRNGGNCRNGSIGGVQAISEPRWLLWWQRRLWQQGDCSNSDMKQQQQCWQEMVAAMATAMAGSNGSSDGQ